MEAILEDSTSVRGNDQKQIRSPAAAPPISQCAGNEMNVELKDLAPLLLKKERAGGDMDPSQLAAIIRGGTAANVRRKQLLKLVETHPVLSDRDMLFRNHTERYNFGVKKAYHYIQLVREHRSEY